MFSLTCKLRLCAGLSQLPSQTSRWAMARAPLSSEANTDSTRSRLSHAFQQFDVMSVGSGGSAAQRFRGLPSTIVNLGGENWIFDAGEGTLRQLVQKFGQSVTDTTRVFITHMHMDHVMGLAALVAANSLRPNCSSSDPLHIYGPLGLHKFLCEIFYSTETVAHMHVVVHELVYTEEDERRLWSYSGPGQSHNHSQGQGQGEGRGGKRSLWKPRRYFDRWPMGGAQNRYGSIKRELIHSTEVSVGGVSAGHHWKLFATPKVTVTAGLIQHTAPCFGFVVEEADKAGPLDAAMIAKLNIPRTSVLADLKRGLDVTLPDGRLVRSSDLIDPNSSIKGRKLTILGDTSCASMLAPIAKDCDLLLHEATLLNKRSSDVISARGHSTPHVAADTARLFGAKRVMLNHISPQFSEFDPLSDIQLQALAGKALGRPQHVIIARDFTTVSVPLGGYSLSDDQFQLHLPLYNGPLPRNMQARMNSKRPSTSSMGTGTSTVG